MARLNRDDWIDAALAAIEVGGLSAAAVEPLALRLSATKGSFYWHFRSRDELLAAVLAEWEHRATDVVIAEVDAAGGSSRDRLASLFDIVFGRDRIGAVDLALFAARDDPAVDEVLRRVTSKRIRYVAGLLRECGLSSGAARRRAVLAYSAFVGHAQLLVIDRAHVRRSVGPLRRYRDEVVEALVGSSVGRVVG